MGLKKKKKHAEEEGGEAWLLPYSDLMTLLLAVFIVLFAVSQVDQAKAEQLAEAFRDSMMTGNHGIFSEDGDTVVPSIKDQNSSKDSSNENTDQETPIPTITSATPSQQELEEYLGKSEVANLEKLKKEVDGVLEEEKLTEDVSTKIDKRGLIITLNNAILFDSGSADIKNVNMTALLHVAKVVKTLDKYIRVEGHTDNVPITSSQYPSNWELSTARASSVVRLFVEDGDVSPDKVAAVGYGEYRPVASNSTAKGRSQNRRIDIIVLSDKYGSMESNP